MSFTQYFEEVAGAARAAPIAIMVSVAAVGSLGLVLLIAASFATVLVPTLLQTKLALPMGQLLLDVLGKRVSVWRCTRRRRVLRIYTRQCTAWVALVEASESVHPDARQRRLVMILAAICGLLGFSATAFSSLVGASVIGLCTSYATLIFLRITSGRHKLVPGPFLLGWWCMPIGSIAWVAFIIVLLCFPPGQKTTVQEMSAYRTLIALDYAVVMVIAVFIALGSCPQGSGLLGRCPTSTTEI